MARKVSEDFKQLNEFIKNYSLIRILDSDNIGYISAMHKKYYSFLTLVGELQNNRNNDNLNLLKDDIFKFILESCSDVGTSFFLSFQGSYKASKLILRSSIETFIKGYFKDLIPEIDIEKSVYKMFENIKELDFYKDHTCKIAFDKIHLIYKELCNDVHTASEINMEKISSLEHFPNYSKNEVKDISEKLICLIQNYLFLLCKKFNSFFHDIHFSNKEVIILSIKKDHKAILNNIQG